MKLVVSVAWIVGSILMLPGGVFFSVKTLQHHHWERRTHPNFLLSRILQTGPQKEALSTLYLAELMGISADRPTHVDDFDVLEAEKKITASPVIRQAHVKIRGSDTIYIDYAARHPVAWLSEFQNTAIDEEGVPFPVFPFFTPKNLPRIILGLDTLQWGVPIKGKRMEMALAIIEQQPQFHFPLLQIDVSKIEEKSLGSRELILVTQQGGNRRFLRLSVKNYAQELGNYRQIEETLEAKPQVIDLRIPNLGFLQNL